MYRTVTEVVTQSDLDERNPGPTPDLSNPSVVLDSLDDERSKFNLGRQRIVNIVSESGLYSLIMRSSNAASKEIDGWKKEIELRSNSYKSEWKPRSMGMGDKAAKAASQDSKRRTT